jgi:ubiquinone/menaquinone biosynthesis C-methylase UbiE
MSSETQIREVVRERYGAAAKAAAEGGAASCGPGGCGCGQPAVFGPELYADEERHELPEAAQLASLGCGNPTAVADLQAGEVVLDLGSGGGIDVLLSARRVGPEGKAYGLDMTEEMLDLARRNQAQAGIENVEWLPGTIEEVPLPDASVDVVISNCVINLSADKRSVLREAARVLRPGGRFAVSDVIADPDMDEATRTDVEQWTGCVAGALTRAEFEEALGAAGLEEVEIEETHRVHEHAASAIVRARKPVAVPDPGQIAECRLDLAGARTQRDRYRSLAVDVTELTRSDGTLSVRFGEAVDQRLLREAIDVERGCCPFFSFRWREDERLLEIGTAEPEQEPALEGLAFALQAPGPPAEGAPRA